MRLRLISTAFTICLLPAVANAQVIFDMGAVTCDQYLAMSPAMSRDFSAWMSGWFSNQSGRRVVEDQCLYTRKTSQSMEIMVPIPSTSKRDGRLAERDWPSMTSWTPGE